MTPEVICDRAARHALAELLQGDDALKSAEQSAVQNAQLPRLQVKGWEQLRASVAALYLRHDHVVVRGLPADGDGAALLWALGLLSNTPRVYRGSKVVKHFRLSPWTTALSHTTAEGHFHTDLNTAATPPAVTGILCLEPDPAAPRYGEVRVARLARLLATTQSIGDDRLQTFLNTTRVSMVSDTADGTWTGTIVDNDRIRFHPETIRAAERRHRMPSQYEDELRSLKSVAMAVSEPIELRCGDILLVSNRRALHYRGLCTVRFTRFPTEFDARRVAVAHAMDEA